MLCLQIDPCPEYDYDASNLGDPICAPEYAFDIFRYYRYREVRFSFNYFNKDVRAALNDWLVGVQEVLLLTHETFYTAIKIVDHFLDKTKEVVEQRDSKLLGAAAMFIAIKFEERCLSPMAALLKLCDFSHEELLAMERNMLRTIGFDIGYPLAYRFLRRYSRVLQLDLPTLTLARYYLETCALYYEFVPTADSLMAAACLLLTLRVKQICDWNPVLEKYSGYVVEDVEPLMWCINHAMLMRRHVYPHLKSSFHKYSSDVFFEVARFPFLKDKFNLQDPVGPPPDCSFKH
uniref:G2/mitotic-specific cyclin-B3 n=1 Tax=Syphacia muris TaxID=451379 RepID=A0A0N5ALH5_9BILA